MDAVLKPLVFGLMALDRLLVLAPLVGVAGVQRIAYPFQYFIVKVQSPQEFCELLLQHFLAHILATAGRVPKLIALKVLLRSISEASKPRLKLIKTKVIDRRSATGSQIRRDLRPECPEPVGCEIVEVRDVSYDHLSIDVAKPIDGEETYPGAQDDSAKMRKWEDFGRVKEWTSRISRESEAIGHQQDLRFLQHEIQSSHQTPLDAQR